MSKTKLTTRITTTVKNNFKSACAKKGHNMDEVLEMLMKAYVKSVNKTD